MPFALPPDPAAMAAAFREFSIEAWTFLGVALAVTMLRTYARVSAVGLKGFQADDYLVWLGATLYTVETALAYSVGNLAHGLANNGMTDEQRASVVPGSEEHRWRVLGSKIQLSGWTTYSTLLWSLKLSLLVLYLRMTAGLSRFYRIRIYIGFAFLAVTYVTVVMNIFLGCRPFHKNWQVYPDPGNVCQPAISRQIIWVCLACNVSTDLYLISIPLPMLWQSTLRPLKKVALMVLFSGGLLVVVCAILRAVLIVIDPINGAQSAGSWAVRETFVAVITTNLPMIFPQLRVWGGSLFESIVTTRRSTQRDKSWRDIRTIGGGGGSGGTGGHSWRGRGPMTANPITKITFDESEERIMDGYMMHDLGAQDVPSSGTASPDANGIRKHVEVTIVSEDRPER